jgi:Spy/CpxP family protein refolding chaperone
LNIRGKALLWVFAIFVIGIVIGVSSAFIFQRARWDPGETSPSRSDPSRNRGTTEPEAVLRSMTERLDLSDEQQKQLLVILQEARDEYRQIHRDSKQSFRESRNQTRARIREILNPDQLAKFDAYIAERKARGSRKKTIPPAD